MSSDPKRPNSRPSLEDSTSVDRLAEAEARERAIIESATDYAILSLTVDGIVTRWSRGAEKTFGHAPGEILGKSSDILWPPEDRATGPRKEREMAALVGVANDDRWMVKKGDVPFFATGAMRPIHNADGTLTGFVKICRDETQRIETQTRLTDARLRLDAAMDAGRIATWVYDIATDQVFSDAMLREFYGVPGTDDRGDPLSLYLRAVHPDDLTRVNTLLRDASATSRSYEAEYRLLTEGKERWVVARGRVEREGTGKAARLVGVVLDITDRKRAEAKLSNAEQQYRELFDSIDEGFCVIEMIYDADHKPVDYRFVAVNAAFEKQTGLREAGDKTLRQLMPEPDSHWFELYGRVADTGESTRLESESPALGRWYDVYAFRYGPAENKQVGVLFNDITGRKSTINALRRSEGNFRQLADAMPQIVWTARPDGQLDYYNHKWFEFIAAPAADLAAARWDQYIHPDDLERVYARWQASLTSGEPYVIEFRVRRADGVYRWFLVRALCIRDELGAITRWLGTCTDIDDQRQAAAEREALLESERAARSDAERSSRMKDEFLATLSHELRTPLNAILGWSQIMRRNVNEPAEIAEGLEVIERNARAQSQLIEDLLDMSRIISGKVRLDLQPLDLAGLVQATVETARPTADAKGIKLVGVIDPLPGVHAQGDANRLQQVMWNLLSNAIKFTPKGGRVQVVLARVQSHLEISVIDTGEGMPAEFLPFAFDRFRQADAGTTRKHGGLGLGLSIVKQLVELHGGIVRVSSGGVGRGTTFVIALPMIVARTDAAGLTPRRMPDGASQLPPIEQVRESLSGVRVLVVDDEADARVMVKRMLEECGAAVTIAGSAADAFDRLRADRYDVLVSDVGMPGEDGYSLIRRVRSLDGARGSMLPAIALTAYARAEDRVKLIAAGFQMHIAKPMEPVELITMVASAARMAKSTQES
jgi:PAS domain S-box-containing protein